MEKWGNVNQKPFMHIPVYSDISRHNQAYSGISQAYSEPCVTLAYSEPEAYLEPYQTSMTANGYNYFRIISFSCPLVHELNMIF